MSASRVVLIPKKIPDYKESSLVGETYYYELWDDVITNENFEGLIGLILNNFFTINKFKALLTHFAQYYASTIRYQTNLANAFLYSQFLDDDKQSYANALATKLHLNNYYIKDDEQKEIPLLHYAIHHGKKNIQDSNCWSAFNNCLKAIDINSVINITDDEKRTPFDLAVGYENELILKLLLEKANALNISPEFSDLSAFLNFLAKHNDLVPLLNYSSISEKILKEKLADDFSIADSLLKQDNLSFIENREFKEPIFNNIQSLYIGLKKGNNAIIRNCLLSVNIVENLNEKNNEGLTPADLAAQIKRYDILCDLYNKGADVSRTLAIIGPLNIQQLLEIATSSLSAAQDDFAFRRLLENYQTDASLLENGFSQFVLDILNNNIHKEALKNLITLFPDLKDRLANYVTRIIDDHIEDGIGLYLAKQLLTSGGRIFPALEVPRGRPTDLPRTIKNLTAKYEDVLTKPIESDGKGALAIITDNAKKQDSSTIYLELPEPTIKENNLLNVEKTFNLDSINAEYENSRPVWRYAFAFAGPKEIGYLLKQAENQQKYHALTPILRQQLRGDKENLNQLVEDIKQNTIAQAVLKKMALERKDFSQRILNHLDTLPLEQAYDILDKSLNDKRNPFHVIWSPNKQNTSDPFGKLVWGKYKQIKEKLLKKARELSIPYFDDTSTKEILSRVRKQTISADDVKKLTQTPSKNLSSFFQIKSSEKAEQTDPKNKFIEKLTQLIARYNEELKAHSSQATEYDRLSDKISICYQCVHAIEQNKSIAGIRQKGEKLDTSVFKKGGILFFIDNRLAKLMEEISKNENQWVRTSQVIVSAAPPPFNPDYRRS